jgi:[acyl-carrier-protein] S-malonyltransferase
MSNDARDLALLFPGQGVGDESLDQAVRAARPDLFELAKELVGEDPFPRAGEGTRFAQPAVYCGSLAGLDRLGRPPAGAVAGHSLGEVTALVAADALTDADGLRVVAARARLMGEAADAGEPGGMLAVGGSHEQAATLARAHGLVLANQNSPRQFVLSGAIDRLDTAERAARESGVRAKRLAVAGAFHSPAMQAAVPLFRRVLDEIDFRSPRVPVISSVTSRPIDRDARDVLAAALVRPVRWVDALRRLEADGIRRFVDVGPGRVLAGLVRRTLDGVTVETNELPELQVA